MRQLDRLVNGGPLVECSCGGDPADHYYHVYQGALREVTVFGVGQSRRHEIRANGRVVLQLATAPGGISRWQAKPGEEIIL